MRRTLVTRDHDVDEFGPKITMCDEDAKFGAKIWNSGADAKAVVLILCAGIWIATPDIPSCTEDAVARTAVVNER